MALLIAVVFAVIAYDLRRTRRRFHHDLAVHVAELRAESEAQKRSIDAPVGADRRWTVTDSGVTPPRRALVARRRSAS
jgi:hypothetical protein